MKKYLKRFSYLLLVFVLVLVNFTMPKEVEEVEAKTLRDLKAEEQGENIVFTMDAIPCDDVPKFNLEAGISKAKLEDMFNGGLEQALPELIEKSGFKF